MSEELLKSGVKSPLGKGSYVSKLSSFFDRPKPAPKSKVLPSPDRSFSRVSAFLYVGRVPAICVRAAFSAGGNTERISLSIEFIPKSSASLLLKPV